MVREIDVVVDKRERRVDLPNMFRMHEDVDEVHEEHLEIGDVIVEGEVVFERKAVGDFVQSIQNRRLESQIERMYDVFGAEKSYVVVEDDYSDFEELVYSDFSPESAYGYVGSISARWQCVPLFTGSRMNLVDAITRIGRKHLESTSRVVRDPNSAPSRSEDDYFERACLQLSGIGRKTVSPLRDEFKTIEGLAKATEGELTSIDGIGKKTAQSIQEQLRGSDD